MEHNGRALGNVHREANERKFFSHFTGFLEGVLASGELTPQEVAPLLAECHEFVTRISDDDAEEILRDFEVGLLEADTVAMMVEVRGDEIDPDCPKSSLNRFLGYCRGIVCDGKITTLEARGIVQKLETEPSLLETCGVREIFNTCGDALEDGIVTQEESASICEAISMVVGDAYGDIGLSDVFGVANFYEHRLDDFPNDLSGARVVLTGTFKDSPRAIFEKKIADLGAEISKSVNGKVDFLVIGGIASRDWIEVNRGTKLRRAMEMRLAGGRKPLLVSEWQLLKLMARK